MCDGGCYDDNIDSAVHSSRHGLHPSSEAERVLVLLQGTESADTESSTPAILPGLRCQDMTGGAAPPWPRSCCTSCRACGSPAVMATISARHIALGCAGAAPTCTCANCFGVSSEKTAAIACRAEAGSQIHSHIESVRDMSSSTRTFRRS